LLQVCLHLLELLLNPGSQLPQRSLMCVMASNQPLLHKLLDLCHLVDLLSKIAHLSFIFFLHLVPDLACLLQVLPQDILA
jgi:hypothetical protein